MILAPYFLPFADLTLASLRDANLIVCKPVLALRLPPAIGFQASGLTMNYVARCLHGFDGALPTLNALKKNAAKNSRDKRSTNRCERVYNDVARKIPLACASCL